jgi:hypothetical protein
MEWFGASLLYECVVANGDGATSPHFEEQIFVLRAEDEASARAAAITIGHANAVSYPNQFDEQVEWRFVTVVDVKQLFDDTIGHGTEVFYRFLTKHEADVLLRAVDSPIDDARRHMEA